MTDQQFSIDFPENKAFKVGVRDLLGAPTDAIVNPANSGLSHGGGLAAVISDEGGSEIDRHCEKYIQKYGQIPVTKAVVTTAGRLPYKGIVHAVGPRMGDGDEQAKIEATLMSCLEIAQAKKWSSIAFPAISTGLFMIPKDVCARAFKNAVSAFWTKNSGTSVRMILLCLTTDDYPEFEKILKSLKEDIKMTESNEYEESESSSDIWREIEEHGHTLTHIIDNKKEWEEHVSPKHGQDLKIIELVDDILKEAIANKADRIYFECFKEKAVYRCEKKGALSPEKLLEDYQPVLDRLKIIFCFDVSEHRVPQMYDPSYLRVRDTSHFCMAHLFTLPTTFGENAMVHLVHDMGITKIDIPEETQNLIKDYLNRKSGLIVTAGRTQRINNYVYYFLMDLIADSGRRIISIDENDKNHDLKKSANVSHVSHFRGSFLWPRTLYAALRFSPDIVMINNVDSKNIDELIEIVSFQQDVVFLVTINSDPIELMNKCRANGFDIERVVKDPPAYHPITHLYTLFLKLPIA